MGKIFRVLSIDGGGIRGLIPAMLLAEIEKRTGKRIAELFEVIAGTSTGGILALALTKPGAQNKPQYAAADLMDFYIKEGTTIFPQSIWREIKTGKNILDEKYPSDGVETVLKRHFGNTRLQEALAYVLIASYEIEKRIPWLFRSERAKNDPANYDFPMWQVARATSAAPTYFEPERIDKTDGSGYWALVDGGVYANNPAMCAFVEARKLQPDGDVLMASLGTGEHTRPIHYQDAKHWGLIGWAKPILDVVFDGVNKTTQFQMEHVLPNVNNSKRYYRFQVSLTKASDDMDNTDPENLEDLKEQAEELIAAHEADLNALCAQLTAPPGTQTATTGR